MTAPSIDVRIISLGTLAAHPLWGEKQPARTGHATCSLIRAGSKVILVDPGLPEAAIAARLSERAGLQPRDVTHVFLTSYQHDTCRGIRAFERATWLIAQGEREGVGVPLAEDLKRAALAGDEDVRARLERDVAVLKRCEAAPDRIAEGVDLFPMPGVTPGLCGLLIARSRSTLLICGDAIATSEHLERGMVLTDALDVRQAQDSFREAVEIADMFVLGRDNLVVNPVRRGF